VEPLVTTIALVGIVVLVASLLSGALDRSGFPIVAVFILLGAILGPPGLNVLDIGFEAPALKVLATLGLALVLFSDAVALDVRALRSRGRMLWRLLGPGTLVPAFLITCAAHWLLALSWPSAAILGAALASTDPVVLRSFLRSRAVPENARLALRLETGMNDVVLLPIVVLAMLAMGVGPHGAELDVADARKLLPRNLLGLFVLGPALGALIGWVGITLLAQVRSRIGVRRDYESLFGLGLAFTGYAGAEAVGGSGFLAAFAAGLVINAQDVELCDCFLEYGEATAEMLLLLTFVALGTSVLWTGLDVIGVRTLLFAVVALTARTAVLYPVLYKIDMSRRDRRLVAFFGPRGLSSLLLTLLPLFAGVRDARHLFAVAALVVLLSVVIHGAGIAWFLRTHKRDEKRDGSQAASLPVVQPQSDTSTTGEEAIEADTVTVDELRTLRARGADVIVLDARAPRSYAAEALDAEGARRIDPDDPVRDATAQRLSKHGTLVVFCA
jgi:NhaP-type Na+/H+ or K+/H+ antiporter